MRIAMVGNFAFTGNQTMATRALPLARLLASRGHEILMALPVRTPGDSPGVERRDAVEIHQIGAKMPFGPQCYVVQVVRMLQLVLRWSPSVVYCFKPIAHSGVVLALLLAARRIGIFRGRLVLDTDDWEGDGGWNEKQPFPGWLKGLIARQEKWTLHIADAVTAASLELVELSRGAGAGRVIYLPNCLEETSAAHGGGSGERFRDRHVLGTGPIVLVYTRFVEYQLERLLRTIESVLARRPDARIVVAGTGLRGEENRLRRLLSERRLEDRVSVLGWIGGEAAQDLFAAADVALYLLDDNLLNRTKCPMKLVELTSAGVPVVADRVGQAAEYISDGETGVLVTSGDVDAMAGAAADLLADPDRGSRMGDLACARAAQQWRWDAWLPALEKALGRSL